MLYPLKSSEFACPSRSFVYDLLFLCVPYGPESANVDFMLSIESPRRRIDSITPCGFVKRLIKNRKIGVNLSLDRDNVTYRRIHLTYNTSFPLYYYTTKQLVFKKCGCPYLLLLLYSRRGGRVNIIMSDIIILSSLAVKPVNI